MLRILACSIVLLLGGCASITGSQVQPISIQTSQGSAIVTGASCTLSNDAGKWFVKTPGSVTVKKSTGDLTVECAKNDASGHENVVSKANTNVWGNILLGGIIGYAVDRNSGAGFDYPGSVTIKMGIGGNGGGTGMTAAARAAAGQSIANGAWKAVMACDASRLRSNSKPYQANFSAEVNGDRVTLHRKNTVAEEVLSGTVMGDSLALDGMGYRLQQSNITWMFKFSGSFTGNAKIYSANGDMVTKGGKVARSCTVVMIHTDVAAPVKDNADEAALEK